MDELIGREVSGLATVAVDADGVLLCEGWGKADLGSASVGNAIAEALLERFR